MHHKDGNMEGPNAETIHDYATAHTSRGSLAYSPSETSHTSTAYRETRMSPTKFRQLKSQYPAQSDKSHVEFVLVASFDIHRGSVMEHQYPGFISSDEHMLAELMLPDQAHSRAQDWTIFFLHKDTASDEADGEDEDELETRRQSRAIDADGNPRSDDEADDEVEGPPLIYVLNLVSTKYDNTATRLVPMDNIDKTMLMYVSEMQCAKPWQFARGTHSYISTRYIFPPCTRQGEIADNKIASPITSSGRILQKSISRNISNIIYSCQCHGPITTPSFFFTRTEHPASQ